VADNIQATFKFRIEDSGNNADGMSFLLLSADDFGDDGGLENDFVEEDPNLAGALGIGFDTFNNDNFADTEEPCPDVNFPNCEEPGNTTRRANHVSLHWDGAQVGPHIILDPAELDLINDDWNEASLIATQVEGGMNVTLVITDGTDNSVHVIFADEFVAGAEFPNGARAAFGGRTGGASSVQSIDDVMVRWTGGGLTGDFNNNGVLDAADIDDLTGQSASGANNATYDLNTDAQVNLGDITVWIKDLKNSWFGDANLDGEFNSSDLVTLFVAGTYEDPNKPAVWTTGDFNGDGLFTSSDLVTALSDGGYEAGPRAAVSAVPEPSSVVLLALGSLLVIRRRR
jgi:hypothetical protein